MEEKLTDQELARRAKLPKYKELGVDPFGQKYDWKNQIRDIRKEYGEVEAEELSSKEVRVDIAGRIMAIRDMGKAAFLNVKDEFGTIQVWIGKNVVGEDNYKVFKHFERWVNLLQRIVNSPVRDFINVPCTPQISPTSSSLKTL